MAVAVAVGGGGAVAVAVAGLTKRFFNHIQKDFLIKISCLFHSLSFWSAHRSGGPLLPQNCAYLWEKQRKLRKETKKEDNLYRVLISKRFHKNIFMPTHF